MQVQQIADQLGVNRKSIQRYTQESQPTAEVIESALSTLNAEIAPLLSVQQRAQKYAKLALHAKNEAVALATLQRVDDLAGIVTQKELVRTRRDEDPRAPQALFMLPAGSQVQVSVTTSKPAINVTPKTPTQDD